MKRTIIKYMIFQPHASTLHVCQPPSSPCDVDIFSLLLYQYPLIDHPAPILFCFENSMLLSNIKVYAFFPSGYLISIFCYYIHQGTLHLIIMFFNKFSGFC